MSDRYGAMDVTLKAAEELPSAGVAFAKEAYENPVESTLTAAKTVVTSGLMGASLGYLIPARGPAAMIVGAAFTIPMVVSAIDRVGQAEKEANSSNGSLDAAAKGLARSTVAGSVDLGLNLAGGYFGTGLGHKAATSDTVFGDFAQKTQRSILRGENESILAANSWSSKIRNPFARTETASATESTAAAGSRIDVETVKSKSRGVLNPKLDGEPVVTAESLAGKPEPTTALGKRLQQYGIMNENIERSIAGDMTDGRNMYFGSLHGHSRYSDGMGLPVELYKKAQAEGQQVTTITDHNHLAARGGVGKDDPRSKDQSGTPVVAEDTKLYAQTFLDAAKTTNSKHVSLVGVEMGTTGHAGGPGHNHGMAGVMTPEGKPFDLAEARAESNAAAHLGGVNHINLFEVPTFFESVKQKPGALESLMARLQGRKPEPILKAPDVIKYNDGDYKGMVDHLDKIKDTSGKTPVIQLNHPRFLADENPNLPAAQRARDYGQKSFSSQAEWESRFVLPYVRQIELIKGGALNPNPVDRVPPGNVDPTSYAGYIGKGVEASPTFGRDFHYGDPVGNPGATGIYAKGPLTKENILDALRERRTIATTSSEKLSGVLTANDGKILMGDVIDHSVVDQLAMKLRLDGKIDPKAEYTVKLMQDKKIQDGKAAEVVQEQKLTGSQLLDAKGIVEFDPLKTKVGVRSAQWVEVGRVDPVTKNLDRMFTGPIFVKPLTGESHSLATKLIAGAGSQWLGTGF